MPRNTRHILPLFASLPTAAALLDMSRTEFARLVDQGSLPGPKNIGGLNRWDTEDLRKIASGAFVDEDFET